MAYEPVLWAYRRHHQLALRQRFEEECHLLQHDSSSRNIRLRGQDAFARRLRHPC